MSDDSSFTCLGLSAVCSSNRSKTETDLGRQYLFQKAITIY